MKIRGSGQTSAEAEGLGMKGIPGLRIGIPFTFPLFLFNPYNPYCYLGFGECILSA